MENNKYTEVLGTLSAFNAQASALTEQFVSFKDAISSSNFISTMDNIGQLYSKVSPLGNILPNIDLEILESPILKLSREANVALSGLTAPGGIHSFTTSISFEAPDWLNQGLPLIDYSLLSKETLGLFSPDSRNLAVLKLSEFAVQSSFARVAETSMLEIGRAHV